MEQWKDVLGYEGTYQVSDSGRVKNIRFGREMIRTLTFDGYEKVALSKNGKTSTIMVHRLVAGAFIGSVSGLQVNHLDENKQNNSLSNLLICTAKENSNYGSRTQRVAEKRARPVVQISRDGLFLNRFYGSREAGRQTGIPHHNIWSCCIGKYKSAGGYLWTFEENYNPIAT
ncbi:MAG: NUMOD4 domain-containing protein [Phycisphaerae bacterium]